MATKTNLLGLMSFALVTACNNGSLPILGEDPSATEQKENNDVQDESPEDSTGSQGSVKVRFVSSTGFSLDGAADGAADGAVEATPVLAISDSVSVSMARFNVRTLKLKPKKDASDVERENDKKECDEDDDIVQSLEAPASASLDDDGDDDVKNEESEDGDGEANNKHKSKDHRKDLAKDREKHEKSERDQDDREHGRDRTTRILGLIYDAVKQVWEGDEPKVDVADGSYRRVEFKLRRNMTLPETDPLLGNVFVIQGKVRVGETDVPFEIEHHAAMNFRLRGDKAFEVVAASDNPLTVVFDVQKWFEGIDLATATVGDDGVIHIDRGSNRAILKQLRRNMKDSTRFGKDHDDDGKLSDDEVVAQGAEATDDDARD